MLPSLVAVALGPFILRKVGLAEYSVLSLATYFYNAAYGYSDFSTYTHLLVSYSKKSPQRKADLGNAFALKSIIFTFLFAALCVAMIDYPRKDNLYPLLAISMTAIILPSTNMEWYFVANKRYYQIFLSRAAIVGLQVLLTAIWFLSNFKSSLFVPAIAPISGIFGSLFLLKFLGTRRIFDWMSTLRLISFRGTKNLILQLSPIAATLFFNPYFLAYALPWYTLTHSDGSHVGAFSISYRLIMGLSLLIVSLLLYTIPRNAITNRPPSFTRSLTFSLIAALSFWIIGIPVLWLYFHISKIDLNLFSFSLHTFTILMVGIFFLCLRTPYVGRTLVSGQYRAYFIIVSISCIPVITLSWMWGRGIPPGFVAWLACLPDLCATAGFIGYSYSKSYLKYFPSTLIVTT